MLFKTVNLLNKDCKNNLIYKDNKLIAMFY